MFSRGRRCLTHVRSRLSAQTTRAILCVGAWSRLGLIASEDVKVVSTLPETDSAEDLENGWDRIVMPSQAEKK